MKKFIIAMALGAAAGMVLSEIPSVKKMMDKGKKKVKNISSK